MLSIDQAMPPSICKAMYLKLGVRVHDTLHTLQSL